MATLLARPHDVPSRSTTPILPLPPHLTLNTSFQGNPAAVPNKHIPYSSPGPVPSYSSQLPSPPDSPPSSDSESSSLLYPPSRHSKLNDSPPIYGLTAADLAAALDHAASKPLPNANLVFPWLHGLHPDNQMQLAFFNARRKHIPQAPSSLRAITIVKAGGDLSVAKLKGAVAPDEILAQDCSSFKEVDPRNGFSVRNFQIQTCKIATVSDIVVYGDDATPRSDVEYLATCISRAQRLHSESHMAYDKFNTFVLTDDFAAVTETQPELVSIDADESLSGHVVDFSFQERFEMCSLSKASEISPGVWLGPTPDPTIYSNDAAAAAASDEEPHFHVIIETTDFARLPDQANLNSVNTFLRKRSGRAAQVNLEFPSSGSLSLSNCTDADLEDFVAFCSWLHHTVTEAQTSGDPIRVLIHCVDGYTETSLLALAYFMYAEGISAHDAWIRLHVEKRRDFFAYPSDKTLLEHMQKQLLENAPGMCGKSKKLAKRAFAENMDGSLPSRILPHLYLGNLQHAQNPDLLRALGITRLLSVGEPICWSSDQRTQWGEENFLYIDKVQDNGVDPLTTEFAKCLDFIDQAKAEGYATLVHCRVGVSRSATICIAQVMKDVGLTLPRAYCFVRARRLNVIIQPHLRFMYELLKWEEVHTKKTPARRELEWATICREIALINKPYCRG